MKIKMKGEYLYVKNTSDSDLTNVPINSLQDIINVVTMRQINLAVKIETESELTILVLFGSFKLTFDASNSTYRLYRLKFIAHDESKWVSASHSLQSKIFKRLCFYYTSFNSSSVLARLYAIYELAFKYLLDDIVESNWNVAFFLKNSDVKSYLLNRFKNGMFSGGWGNAEKSIGKFLRNTIHKESMLIYRKVYPYISFIDVTLFGYLDFIQSYRVVGDCGSLYPLIPSLSDGSVCDGSNEWFFSRVKGKLTRGDIKVLRKAPPSLFYSIGAQDSFFPLKLVSQLLRHSFSEKFPVPILLKILKLQSQYIAFGRDSPVIDWRLLAVTDKWLTHHRTIWRTQGYKKHRIRWEDYLEQLRHVFDWVSDAEPHIHKNQYWTSILRNAMDWHPHLKLLTDGLKWKPIVAESVEILSVSYSELSTSEALFEEGDEMHHCVYSYSERCYRGLYRIFRVESPTERATAGVALMNGNYRLDQLYSYCNEPVTTILRRSALKFIQHLNFENKSNNKVNTRNG